eukprot:GABV01000317.1.p1 GENE.GABV01000317.1~~GABV01000317.1.p1  ORF type:complete len:289 (+),score=110.31 GABV01000317.1:262-1128(+)
MMAYEKMGGFDGKIRTERTDRAAISSFLGCVGEFCDAGMSTQNVPGPDYFQRWLSALWAPKEELEMRGFVRVARAAMRSAKAKSSVSPIMSGVRELLSPEFEARWLDRADHDRAPDSSPSEDKIALETARARVRMAVATMHALEDGASTWDTADAACWLECVLVDYLRDRLEEDLVKDFIHQALENFRRNQFSGADLTSTTSPENILHETPADGNPTELTLHKNVRVELRNALNTLNFRPEEPREWNRAKLESWVEHVWQKPTSQTWPIQHCQIRRRNSKSHRVDKKL